MITDNKKNFIYLADTLPSKMPSFYKHFVKAIATAGLEYGILKGTSDIWAVDYMPVQLADNQFVQYIFKPDYLTTRKYFHLITDAERVWNNLGLETEVVSCDLVLDGGNLVYEKDTLIVTDKVFNILKVNKLKYICAPCGCRECGLSAMGLYINFLQVGNTIFVPVFDIEQDERAVKFFEDVFSGCNIIPVKSKQIAKRGGVFRCVSCGVMI